jgi:hypothetical protein
VKMARSDPRHPHLAPVLQQGRKSAKIRVSLGIIRGIPVKAEKSDFAVLAVACTFEHLPVGLPGNPENRYGSSQLGDHPGKSQFMFVSANRSESPNNEPTGHMIRYDTESKWLGV